MENFIDTFLSGFYHIIEWGALDHLAFLLVLCAGYRPDRWKEILILATAFTIGHSLTLALVSFDAIRVNKGLTEFLIQLTILITAIYNLLRGEASRSKWNVGLGYVFALCFGLIHGLGFARQLMFEAPKGESIILPLLSFNLGIEAAQVLVVLVIMLIAFLALNVFNVSQKDWRVFISAFTSGIAVAILL